MKTYTVGFIFNQDLSCVLLMHKNRPEWQNGKVNGIGGTIEPGEESVACMVREAREETGLQTTPDAWVFLGAIYVRDSRVDYYALVHSGLPDEASTRTDERVEWFDVFRLPNNVLSNLAWLISFAFDRIKNNGKQTFDVRYK